MSAAWCGTNRKQRDKPYEKRATRKLRAQELIDHACERELSNSAENTSGMNIVERTRRRDNSRNKQNSNNISGTETLETDPVPCSEDAHCTSKTWNDPIFVRDAPHNICAQIGLTDSWPENKFPPISTSSDSEVENCGNHISARDPYPCDRCAIKTLVSIAGNTSAETGSEPYAPHSKKAQIVNNSPKDFPLDLWQGPFVDKSSKMSGESETAEVVGMVEDIELNEEELIDAACDPNNPVCVQFQDVSAAAFKIKSGIERTPCTRSHMSSITEMEIYFKKEFLQYTGSFKERGARYTLMMLSKEQKAIGVIAASAGNHALALAYHGNELKIPVTVVMPIVAPIMKVSLCRQYGANIIVHGQDISESRKHAMKLARVRKFYYVNGYDHPHILAGQGTMGLEICEQVPDLDALVIPVGGGGLIAGTALAVKSLYPHVQVIGVESERCSSFTASLEAGHPIFTKASSTLADGLAVPLVGVNAFATGAPLIDKMVIVSEEFIALSILRLVELEKAVVEGAGATGLAAVLAGLLPELKGKKVVIPLCGGNIDTTVLGRCLERGLAVDGRLCRFVVTVSDRPGGIAELTKHISSIGVSLKDIFHERAWLKSDIFSVQVKCVVETRDAEHADELMHLLKRHYTHLSFGPKE